MKILVVNAGSSSLKYQLIDMQSEEVMGKGICERVGTDDAVITHKTADGKKIVNETAMPTHKEAFDAVVAALTSGEGKVIDSLEEISAVGHRVVQGGAIFNESVLIDKKVVEQIDELSALAPLHNPAHVMGINACTQALGENVPQVAVFDTAFHQTMPAASYIFPIPYEYYEKYAIRRYGAHGTSHRYVSDRCAEIMGKDKKDVNIITCHLGNGCSITAVKNGVCFDTSMGLTPLGGFMMGTRSGSLDPSVVLDIMEKENLTPAEMNNILNKKSGLLGVSGLSNDNRDIVAAMEEGHERATLALEIQNYSMTKFIGAYAAGMGGVDAIVFTGGIGENEAIVREYICKKLEFLGFELDEKNNATRSEEIEISKAGAKVRVFVIPTNEELVIARDTKALISK